MQHQRKGEAAGENFRTLSPNMVRFMAANVLSSKRAVEASVQVVRAFVKLRQMLASNAELALKLDELERKYDHQFKIVFDAIRESHDPNGNSGQTDWLSTKTAK